MAIYSLFWANRQLLDVIWFKSYFPVGVLGLKKWDVCYKLVKLGRYFSSDAILKLWVPPLYIMPSRECEFFSQISTRQCTRGKEKVLDYNCNFWRAHDWTENCWLIGCIVRRKRVSKKCGMTTSFAPPKYSLIKQTINPRQSHAQHSDGLMCATI